MVYQENSLDSSATPTTAGTARSAIGIISLVEVADNCPHRQSVISVSAGKKGESLTGYCKNISAVISLAPTALNPFAENFYHKAAL